MFFFVALLLLLVLPSPWNVVGFIAGLAAFGGEVVFWNRRVRGKKVATGADTVIGERAVVVSSCRPDGQVRLQGEVWNARCAEGADAGDDVLVTGRDGLTLVVERAPGA